MHVFIKSSVTAHGVCCKGKYGYMPDIQFNSRDKLYLRNQITFDMLLLAKLLLCTPHVYLLSQFCAHFCSTMLLIVSHKSYDNAFTSAYQEHYIKPELTMLRRRSRFGVSHHSVSMLWKRCVDTDIVVLLGNLIDFDTKYFLRLISPFRWFKKGSCQFFAKEYALYWLTT